MKASDARKLSEANLQGPAIKPFVNEIIKRISAAARGGQNSVDPWFGMRDEVGDYPTLDEQEAIRKHFEKLGYTWNDYPDPDPGHPCSRPYTTVSW